MNRKKILFISPFHPNPDLSPRHRAMFNHQNFFKNKGYDITFIHLSNEKVEIEFDINFIQLKLPNLNEVFKNIFGKVLFNKDFCLQSSIFFSKSIHSFLTKYKNENNYDFVFFESIRTTPYHRIFNSQFKIIDLGDLISRRYMLLYKSKISVGNVFGQFNFNSNIINNFLSNFLIQKIILFIEAKLVKRAEKNAAIQFDSIILVSEYEKELLKNDVPNANIHHIPNIDFMETRTTPRFKSNKVISYFGILNNPHNEHTILYFLKNIFQELIKKNNGIQFNIYGKNPSEKIKNAAKKYDNVLLKGYVNDLEDAIKDTNLLVVPITAGSGVKTKVLDGMRWGVPIVSSFEGVSGLINIGESGVLVSKNDLEFINKINIILEDDKFGKICSQKSLKYYKKYYSKDSIYNKYDSIIR